MATDVVRVSGTEPDPAVVAMAVELLSAGSLLIYPTDTLYALGGRVLDAAAGVAVRRAKGREEGKPLPVVAADLAQARDLCRAWPEVADRLAGPLVSTSANRAGGSPPMTCADALEAVGAAAALALDGGHGRAGASTIVDLTSTPPRLLRAGLVPWEEIEGVLRPGER